MTNQQQPFKDFSRMQVKFHSKIWGGQRLEELFSQMQNTGPIGEVSFHPSDPNINFPLILKLIDAAADLSIQVHPKKEDLEYFHKQDPDIRSKEESWLILGHDHQAKISLGLKKSTNAAEIKESIKNTKFETLLQTYEVQENDLFHVPAGTIHTIGAGIFLMEIQQNSETTFRIYDFDRQDFDGNKRELHLEQALYSLNYHPSQQSYPIKMKDISAKSQLETHRNKHRHKCLLEAENYRIESVQFSGKYKICFNNQERVLMFNIGSPIKIKSTNDILELDSYRAVLSQPELRSFHVESKKNTLLYFFTTSPKEDILTIKTEY